MVVVSLHYWAGARAAAGVETESIQTNSVAEALRQAEAARDDPRFSRVLQVCSLLVDGVTARPADLERPLSGPVRVDVLPPFAGGANVTQITQQGCERCPMSRIVDRNLIM